MNEEKVKNLTTYTICHIISLTTLRCLSWELMAVHIEEGIIQGFPYWGDGWSPPNNQTLAHSPLPTRKIIPPVDFPSPEVNSPPPPTINKNVHVVTQ